MSAKNTAERPERSEAVSAKNTAERPERSEAVSAKNTAERPERSEAVSAKNTAKELALWALRKRRPWRVQGTSMVPEYRDGDRVLVDPDRPVRVGAAVVARHPFKNVEVIKYVKAIDPDGYVVLESPGGEDSNQFGRAPLHTIRGTVTFNRTTRSHS